MRLREFLTLTGAVFLLLTAFSAGRCSAGRADASGDIRRDSVVRWETLTVLQPRTVRVRELDTVLMAGPTKTVHDTVYVALPRQQIEWRDSFCTVWASGIRPRVDSVRHFLPTVTITGTRTQPVPRWNFSAGAGLAAGYFLTPAGWQAGAGPAVTIGLTYRF